MVSRVHRLLVSDRVPSAAAQDGGRRANRFFASVNLRRALARLSDSEYRQVAAAIEQSRRKLHFLFLGYVLMPDHWHALIWPAYPLTISRVIQDIKWIGARSLNQARHSSGQVWQHQFWDRFVRHAQEFRERLDYMHLNPVRKGLVRYPEDWRWSSYNNYGLDKGKIKLCPMQIDDVHLPESYRG
jgi:REP element-mobilizing transposase RayT